MLPGGLCEVFGCGSVSAQSNAVDEVSGAVEKICECADFFWCGHIAVDEDDTGFEVIGNEEEGASDIHVFAFGRSVFEVVLFEESTVFFEKNGADGEGEVSFACLCDTFDEIGESFDGFGFVRDYVCCFDGAYSVKVFVAALFGEVASEGVAVLFDDAFAYAEIDEFAEFRAGVFVYDGFIGLLEELVEFAVAFLHECVNAEEDPVSVSSFGEGSASLISDEGGENMVVIDACEGIDFVHVSWHEFVGGVIEEGLGV